jgi:HK97 family phage prohead protease
MTNTLHRINFFPDIQISRAKGGQRIISGISVPFDTPTFIREFGYEYWEEIQRGAFAKSIAEAKSPFKLNMIHDRVRLPIGVALETREDAAGLYQEFKIAAVERGDEVLALLEDGVPLGLSIGAVGVKHNGDMATGRVWRTEVALKETSVVNEPAYPDARIMGVRYASFEDEKVEAEHSEPDPPPEAVKEPEPDTSTDEPPKHSSTEPSARDERLARIGPVIDWLNKQKEK